MGCSLPTPSSPSCPLPVPPLPPPHFCSSTFHIQSHSSTSHFIPLPHPPLLPLSPFHPSLPHPFFSYPLPSSPSIFPVYLSSFTFIICLIFYLFLPHPLYLLSFSPSLPSIILPLLVIP